MCWPIPGIESLFTCEDQEKLFPPAAFVGTFPKRRCAFQSTQDVKNQVRSLPNDNARTA